MGAGHRRARRQRRARRGAARHRAGRGAPGARAAREGAAAGVHASRPTPAASTPGSMDDVGAAGRLRLGDRGRDRGRARQERGLCPRARRGARRRAHVEHLDHPARRAAVRRHHALLQPAALPALLEVVGDENALADVIACADERLGKTVVLCKRRARLHREPARRDVDRRRASPRRSRAASTSSSPTPPSRARSARRRPASSGCSTWSASTCRSTSRARSTTASRPADPLQAVDRPLAAARARSSPSGRTGRKGYGGFYRLAPDRTKLALDLASTSTGRPAATAATSRPAPRTPLPCATDARVRRAHPRRGLRRSRRRRPRDGGGLRLARGPFAMLGRPPAAAPAGPVRTSRRREAATGEPRPRQRLGVAVGLGEGVLCLEFHTKMNAIDGEIVAPARGDHRDGADARSCCTTTASSSASARTWRACCCWPTPRPWHDLDGAIRAGQETFSALRARAVSRSSARRPGMALGGGCEILLHCDAIQAHAESYIGLPEVGRRHRARLGRLPAPRPAAGRRGRRTARWRRCRRRSRRSAWPRLGVGGRGARARLPPPDDRITMNRDRLLGDAKRLRAGAGRRLHAARAGRAAPARGRPVAPRSCSASPATRWPAGRCRTTGRARRRSRACWPAATPIRPRP